jgi:biotin transport system substrate-specific component
MMTMADVLMVGSGRRSFVAKGLLEVGLVVTASVVVAMFAQLQYVLPVTPVPITGQTLAVLLVGAALGSRRGALAMGVYLVEGAVGIPVFAGGGLGLPWLLGPTAGYLWSLPLAAWIVGWLAERGWDRGPVTAALSMLAGNGVIYLVGLPWLAVFVGWEQVLSAGLLPFIPGDLIKVAIAAAVLPTTWALVGRAQQWAGEHEA